MGKIYDLGEKQRNIYDRLFWAEEGSDEWDLLQRELQVNKVSAEGMIRFLSSLILEARAQEQALKEAQDKAAAYFKNKRKRAKSTETRLKIHIAGLMKNFDIKRLECELADITLLKNAKKVGYGDSFSVDKLPEKFVHTEIKKTPDAEAIMEALEAGEVVTGAYIIETPSLRVV